MKDLPRHLRLTGKAISLAIAGLTFAATSALASNRSADVDRQWRQPKPRVQWAAMSEKRAGPPQELTLRTRPDGTKRFKLEDVAVAERVLPDRDQCENIGRKFSQQLTREGGDSVRFWVRMGPGDFGYCQRVRDRWYVEYYDRSSQDALLIEVGN